MIDDKGRLENETYSFIGGDKYEYCIFFKVL